MPATTSTVGDFVRRVVQLMDEVFRAPGLITHAAASTCAACAGHTMPCLEGRRMADA